MSKNLFIQRLDNLAGIVASNINSQTSTAAFNSSINFLEDEYSLTQDEMFYVIMNAISQKQILQDEVIFEISKKFSLKKLNPQSTIYNECNSAYEAAVARHPKIKPVKESTRRKEDLEKIAEDLYKEIKKIFVDSKIPEYKKAEKIADFIFYQGEKTINNEKGFGNYNHEKLFILAYLITKKHLFNKNSNALFLVVQKQYIPDYSQLFTEIAIVDDIDLLDRFVATYVKKITDTSEQQRKIDENIYKDVALITAKILRILRSDEKSDEEKYVAILSSPHNQSNDARLFVEANFKDSKKYLEKFLTYLSPEDCEIFLRKYKEFYKEKFFEDLPNEKLPSFDEPNFIAIKDPIEANKEKRVKSTSQFEKIIWDVEARESIRNPSESDIVKSPTFKEEMLEESPPASPRSKSSDSESTPQDSSSKHEELVEGYKLEDSLKTELSAMLGTKPRQDVKITKREGSLFTEVKPKDPKSK